VQKDIEVIRNFVNCDVYKPFEDEAKRTELRARYAAPNEKIIIPSEAVMGEDQKANDSGNSLYTISRLPKNEKNILSEIVWIKDNLEFDNQTFQDLSPQLESWFSVKIHFGDEVIKQRRFSGSIEKETLEQTLSAMQISFPFKYYITGNDVWINQKKN